MTYTNLKKLTRLTFILMIASLFFQIIFTNIMALKGNEFNELLTKKASLEKYVSMLEFQDSQLNSISSIYERASKLGFAENTGTISSVTNISSSSVAVLTHL